MKKVLLILVLVISVSQIKAQRKNNDSKIRLNVGGEIGLATGDLNSRYSLGLGATVNLEYLIDEKLTAYANSGLIEFIGKKIPGTNTKYRSTATFPIIGGVKYYFANNFYGTAALGVTIFSGAGIQSNKFTYLPGLGFKANDKVDILFKYTGYANAGGAFGVRVSYAL
jgi:hypothetical protein